MLAATIGQTVLAAGPVRPASAAAFRADEDEDSDLDDDELASGGGMAGYDPYETLQYAPPTASGLAPVPGSEFGPAPAPGPFPPAPYAPGMGAPDAWPEDSLYNQHRLQQTYNNAGLWEYNNDDNFARQWYFGLDYLYGHGLRPGPHYIGSPQYHAQDFFIGFPNVFPQQTTELFGNVFHDGIMPRLGYWNPDGSGAQLSGFILFENSVDNGLVQKAAVAGQLTTLSPRASIVLDNGDGTAQNVPFDTRFFQRFTQEILGADADYYVAPFFERQSFKLRVLYGAKYLRVHEDFSVQASDSGLGYVVNVTQNTIQFNTITNIGINPYTLFISSSTTNNLVGPNMGLRYDLGGDTFKLWGQTKLGIAADVEKLSVAGLNVVQGFQAGGAFSPPTLHTKTNTHVSPFVDTSIFMEFPGFQLIPWVCNMNCFKNAKMRIGYQFVFVGEIARAPGIIVYNYGDPLVQQTRTWFSYNTVNFAVDWRW
jgi:hypothetical protein